MNGALQFGVPQVLALFIVKVKLPIRWLSPESLSSCIFNQKTDVWTFEILMWEVCALGNLPHRNVNVVSDPEKFLAYLRDGDRLKKPPVCSEELYVRFYGSLKSCIHITRNLFQVSCDAVVLGVRSMSETGFCVTQAGN